MIARRWEPTEELTGGEAFGSPRPTRVAPAEPILSGLIAREVHAVTRLRESRLGATPCRSQAAFCAADIRSDRGHR
jgi:hypothetical protein